MTTDTGRGNHAEQPGLFILCRWLQTSRNIVQHNGNISSAVLRRWSHDPNAGVENMGSIWATGGNTELRAPTEENLRRVKINQTVKQESEQENEMNDYGRTVWKDIF